MLAMAPAAQAIVVTYAGPPLPITNNLDGIYVNVVTGAFASSPAPTGWDFNVYNNTAGLAFFTRAADTANAYVGSGTGVATQASSLALGTTIGPASTFASTGQVQGAAFQTAGTRYFGFRFTNEAPIPTNSTIHYGWALLNTGIGTGANAGFPASIVSYAFETTPGLAITIPIPEPSTYLLMALGLAAIGGVAARRRKTAAA